jgi:hypothetical protein
MTDVASQIPLTRDVRSYGVQAVHWTDRLRSSVALALIGVGVFGTVGWVTFLGWGAGHLLAIW